MVNQFVLDLIRQTFDLTVIQMFRNVRGFVVGVLADFLFLPLNVARVFDVDFDLLTDEFVLNRVVVQWLFGLETGVVCLYQLVVVDVRSAQQIGEIVLALNGFAEQLLCGIS